MKEDQRLSARQIDEIVKLTISQIPHDRPSTQTLEMVNKLNERMDGLVTQKDFQDFRDEVKPYLQGMAGLGILWKILIGLGSLLAVYAAMKYHGT